jgi:hypothetical protein
MMLKELSDNKTYIFIIVSFLSIMFLGFLFLLKNKKTSEHEAISIQNDKVRAVLPTVILNRGSFQLETKDNIIRFPIGQEATFFVKADSDGQSIAGYDVVLEYDKNAFDLVKANSLIPDFKIFNFRSGSHTSITGTKSIESSKSFVFKNTPLVEMAFRPKKAGRFNFILKQVINKERTKMIDDKTNVTYPNVNNIALEIY